jgi:hypothetical protein
VPPPEVTDALSTILETYIKVLKNPRKKIKNGLGLKRKQEKKRGK